MSTCLHRQGLSFSTHFLFFSCILPHGRHNIYQSVIGSHLTLQVLPPIPVSCFYLFLIQTSFVPELMICLGFHLFEFFHCFLKVSQHVQRLCHMPTADSSMCSNTQLTGFLELCFLDPALFSSVDMCLPKPAAQIPCIQSSPEMTPAHP